jgi:hypothetical protein
VKQGRSKKKQRRKRGRELGKKAEGEGTGEKKGELGAEDKRSKGRGRRALGRETVRLDKIYLLHLFKTAISEVKSSSRRLTCDMLHLNFATFLAASCSRKGFVDTNRGEGGLSVECTLAGLLGEPCPTSLLAICTS